MRPTAKCNRALQRKHIPLYGDMCVHLHSQKHPITERHFFEKYPRLLGAIMIMQHGGSLLYTAMSLMSSHDKTRRL